jgi:hypothetical protein
MCFSCFSLPFVLIVLCKYLVYIIMIDCLQFFLGITEAYPMPGRHPRVNLLSLSQLIVVVLLTATHSRHGATGALSQPLDEQGGTSIVAKISSIAVRDWHASTSSSCIAVVI